MKDEDIKLPKRPLLRWEQRGSEWVPYDLRSMLDSIDEYAREAVRLNLPAKAAPEPQPFNLEAAKRGERLVTRAGRNARFIAHVPDAAEDLRIVYMVEGCACPKFAHEDGLQFFEGWSDDDLFMAPKPKRTVYVNLYRKEDAHKGFITATWFEDAIAAREFAPASKALVVAYPVEIDAD